MKKSIFVTGIAGSGKSTLCKASIELGYEAYDIEHDKYGLFMMLRKDTGERFIDYDNADPEKTKNALWACDKKKLKKLIENQKSDLAFYCGIASHNEELISLFDKSFVLSASPEILDERLLSREGTDDYGNTKTGRQRILNHKNEFEEKMIEAGMITIDADPTPKEVVQRIVDSIQ